MIKYQVDQNEIESDSLLKQIEVNIQAYSDEVNQTLNQHGKKNVEIAQTCERDLQTIKYIQEWLPKTGNQQYVSDFASFFLNQKMDVEDEVFLKNIQCKDIRNVFKMELKNFGVGITDTIFDKVINSIKQAVLKDVGFLS